MQSKYQDACFGTHYQQIACKAEQVLVIALHVNLKDTLATHLLCLLRAKQHTRCHRQVVCTTFHKVQVGGYVFLRLQSLWVGTKGWARNKLLVIGSKKQKL